MQLQEAIDKNYPLMGFSLWHRLVANRLSNLWEHAHGHNAVICFRSENIVIQGVSVSDTKYFIPQKVAFERSRRYPTGKKIMLKEFILPHEIAYIIQKELNNDTE